MTEHSAHNPEQDQAKNEQFLTKPEDLQKWGATIEPLFQQAEQAVATDEDRRREANNTLVQLEDSLYHKKGDVSRALKELDQAELDMQSQINNAASREIQDQLLPKLQAIQDAIKKLEEQEATLKDEDILQDSSVEYLKVSLSDLQQEKNRREWQMQGIGRNQIRLFGEEADLSRFDKFLKPQADLPDNYSLPASNIDPQMDPHEAETLLNQLPYVHPNSIKEIPFDRKNPVVQIAGGVSFPVDRIVSLPASEKWAGKGNKAADIGGYEHLYPEGVPDSTIGKIIAYASRRVPVDEVTLKIFRDAAGEYWGAAMHDSSHRLAAAKLRGETTITPKMIIIKSEDEMDTVPFSVRQRFTKPSN